MFDEGVRPSGSEAPGAAVAVGRAGGGVRGSDGSPGCGAPAGVWSRVRALAGELALTHARGLGRVELVEALEALATLEGAVAVAQATLTEAVDALDDRGADGVQVLRSVAGCSEREARRRGRRAETLGRMPTAAGLLGEGRLSVETADVLVGAARRVSPEAVESDDRLLAQVAGRPADVARRVVDAWVARRQSVGDAEQRLERQRRNRAASRWVDGRDGMHRYRLELDPVTAAGVDAVLDAEIDRLWRADGGRDGRPDEVRTPEQRRADAFVRLLGVRAPGPETDPDLPGGRGTAATIVVVTDLGVIAGTDPDGRCEIVDSGPVPPSVLAELARRSDTTICGTLFDGPGRPLWLGRTRRLASAAQRLVLAVRDRGCVACDAPFRHTQAHHVTAHRHGGPTDVDQMVSLCPTCHTRTHAGHLELHADTDGSWHAVAAACGGPGPDPP